MLESERVIEDCAREGEPAPQRVCSQLLAQPPRYSRWHDGYENRMSTVADARVRARQILVLRAFALEQIHRAALVRYLRDYHVVGSAREMTLRDFHGVLDTRDAAVSEHRGYLLAATNQVCAAGLLEIADDLRGAELLAEYERAYGQFFSMFCEHSRANQSREPYLLESLLPEVRAVVARIRGQILDGDSPRRVPRGDPRRGLVAIRPLAIQAINVQPLARKTLARGL
ncbi:MAG: hypothetical protein ABI640_06800 [Gammaproteobacteria bacterium]